MTYLPNAIAARVLGGALFAVPVRHMWEQE